MKNTNRVRIAVYATLLIAVIATLSHAFSQQPPNATKPDSGLLTRAESNSPEEQYQLALSYRDGTNGFQKDVEAALHWLRKAADQNHSEAENTLGTFYEAGLGVQQSDEEAMRWYQRAADHHSAKAAANIGRMYDAGLGVKQDKAEALKWFQQSADLGFPYAKTYVGAAYKDGTYVQQDYSKALSHFNDAVAEGDVHALSHLAEMYLNGWGVEKDLLRSGELYGQSAKNGSEDVQSYLEETYKRCPKTISSLEELTQNRVEACLLGAGAGYAPAQHIAGQIFFWGHLVESDKEKALELTKAAADQGYEPAQREYIVMDAVEGVKKISK